MQNLLNLRNSIDHIDKQILQLLKQRSLLIPQVKQIKAYHNQKIAFARELQMYNNFLQADAGLYNNTAIQKIWREIISATLQIENSINIGVYSKNNLHSMFELTKDHFGVSANIIKYKSADLLKQHLLNKTLNCAVVNNSFKQRKQFLCNNIKQQITLPVLKNIPQFKNTTAMVIGLSN